MDAFIEYLSRAKREGVSENVLGDNVAKVKDEDLTHEEIEQIGSLLTQIRERTKSVEIVVVDGFLLFCDPPCIDLLDLPVFMHAPHETLKARRNARTGYITLEGIYLSLYIRRNTQILRQELGKILQDTLISSFTPSTSRTINIRYQRLIQKTLAVFWPSILRTCLSDNLSSPF